MNIIYKNLRIRKAEFADAEQLFIWWNDGKVMSHAGFYNGLGCTIQEIVDSLKDNTYKPQHRHIIEVNNKAIGEMNYHENEDIADIGIKICDFSMQEKGYGTEFLVIFTDALFRHLDFEKVTIDTDLRNTRAQHVYKNKLGFNCSGVKKNSWKDQLGELQSAVYFEISKTEWIARHKLPLNYTYNT